jgi:predicted TIM-barrel fold metal-dependent hydrolase
MLIVDAQVHIWSSGTPMAPHLQVSHYGADELLREMANAGVDAALIHPPSWDPRSHELAVDAARVHPNQFAILGYLPPDQARSRDLIDGWKSQLGVLGLRALRPGSAGTANLARRWHNGLAVAGGGAGRSADRPHGQPVLSAGRPNR